MTSRWVRSFLSLPSSGHRVELTKNGLQRNSPRRSPVPNLLVRPHPLAAPSPPALAPVPLPPALLPLAIKRCYGLPSFLLPLPSFSSSFFVYRTLFFIPLPFDSPYPSFLDHDSQLGTVRTQRRTKRRGVRRRTPPCIIPFSLSSSLSLSSSSPLFYFLVETFCNMYSVAQFCSSSSG
jgi:hypothetical protein